MGKFIGAIFSNEKNNNRSIDYHLTKWHADKMEYELFNES